LWLVNVVGVLLSATATAGPAHIWLSDNIHPEPQAQTLTSVVDRPRMLAIWAQPATDDPNNGAYKTLRNFSLDLNGPDLATVDFLDTASAPPEDRPITVYNPTVGGSVGRFETVSDSTSMFEGDPDPLLSLQDVFHGREVIRNIGGFTLVSSSFSGINNQVCATDDPYCNGNQSDDAWLLGTVWYTPRSVTSPSGVGVTLEIGANGMTHAVGSLIESTSLTDVRFGTDVVSYNASTQRQMTVDVNHEALVAGMAAATSTTWSGTSDDWSTAIWSGGAPTTGAFDATLMPLDGETLIVTGYQRAGHTLVESGQLRIAGAASLASDITVGSGGTISGGGWLLGNLDNADDELGETSGAGGTHAIGDRETLTVLGTAEINGATLALTDDYVQTPSVVPEVFTLLRAGTLIGEFANDDVDTYLGNGIYLRDIDYDDDAVSVTLYSSIPGDYDGNGQVNVFDYFVWESQFGMSGDLASNGNRDARVTAADYVVWRNHCDPNQVDCDPELPNGAIASGVGVPEPASWLLLLGSIVLSCAGRHCAIRWPLPTSSRG
jgi:hypothetical protein